jgi:hypothetical protein
MIILSNINIFTVISFVAAVTILFFIIYCITFKPLEKSNSSFLIFSIITLIITTSAFFMTLADNHNFALILANVQVFGVILQPIATLILIINFAG